MKDKYTPVPDTPVLIRAKRAYLNASDVSTPGAPHCCFSLDSAWKEQEKDQWGINIQTQNISVPPSTKSIICMSISIWN